MNGAEDLLAIDNAILDEYARQLREAFEAELRSDIGDQTEESGDDDA